MADDLTKQIAAAPDLPALEQLRVAALGKSGSVTALLKSLGSMDPETRAREGPGIHALREAVASAIATRKEEWRTPSWTAAGDRAGRPFPTLDDRPGAASTLLAGMDEWRNLRRSRLRRREGPEIEDQWKIHALKCPSAPARAMQDTFSSTRGSTAKSRACSGPTPRRADPQHAVAGAHCVIAPAGSIAATATPPTRQCSTRSKPGHDRAIHMGHLKWTLETFLKAFFERDNVAIRMRPSYFPFTEPSAEVDVGWSMDKGRRVVGGAEGWMEVLGSGMVHPRVIAACGLDPDEWQGFAFGTGVDRLAMLKYGMDDLRAFFDGDLRWLKHYGFSFLDVPTLSAGVGA